MTLPQPMIDNNTPPFLVCTFSRTGKNPIKQKIYHCKTCGIVDDICICESCAKICHFGHDVKQVDDGECYCDCGAGAGTRPCMCRYGNIDPSIQQKQDPKPIICTFASTGKTDKKQRIYRCRTCGLGHDNKICESCARTCHFGHEIYYDGEEQFFCSCGAGGESGRCKCLGGMIPNVPNFPPPRKPRSE